MLGWAILLAASLLWPAATGAQTASPPLILEAKIPLGEVSGRIDHLSVDAQRQRLLVAELGNNSLGVVDLATRKVLRRITGLSEPQGVAYVHQTHQPTDVTRFGAQSQELRDFGTAMRSRSSMELEGTVATPASPPQFRTQVVRDTVPELELRRELHRRGLRYRLQVRVLPAVRRSSDIVFASARVIVDVRGCWWHGCTEHRPDPATNREWWAAKRRRNAERDRDTVERLQDAGWRVVIVWEHEAPMAAADRVEAAVRHNRPDRPDRP